MKKMISAKVVADSTTHTGGRLTTFELEYPRIIHGELMTHRMFSRSAASSRAIPIDSMIDMVWKDPAMPVHWGLNQSGMQAEQEHSHVPTCQWTWSRAASRAIRSARELQSLGLHKQIVNRVIEPYQWMKTLVTATEFDNFFWLRCHKDAQPEIHVLAENAMYPLYQKSEPKILNLGEWHVPYYQEGFWSNKGQGLDEYGTSLEEAQKISASCCAQTSYRKSDETLEKALKVYNKLIESEPAHCYDSQTEVLTREGFKFWENVNSDDELADVDENTLEFKGFKKPLALIHHKHSGKMYYTDTSETSFRVTGGHKMLGHLVSVSGDRHSEFLPKPFIIGGKTGPRRKLETWGEVEVRLPEAPKVTSKPSALGRLIGMYIGDGFKVDSTMAFHYKKERKGEFLEVALRELGWEYSLREEKEGAKYLRVYVNEGVKEILETCGNGASNKRIGVWEEEIYPSIFEGLKNSDGSVKRGTWSYSTTSETLKEDFLDYAPIAGLSVRENKKQKGGYKLMVKTKKEARVNDSRKPQSKVLSEEVKGENVYCATMPSGALVVRRKGKTLVSGNCSPFEHIGAPMTAPNAFTSGYEGRVEGWEQGVTHMDRNHDLWSGNFKGFIQYRQLIKNNNCTDYKP